MAENFSLSTVKPDYQSINEQLSGYLAQKASWLSLGKSSTGTLLIEAISFVGESSQYSIQAAVNETTLRNAKIAESIYTNCRFLGVRVSRKIPAERTAILQNNNLNATFLEVPAFTEFDIEGTKYFNRESFVFNASTYQQQVTLYQGEIKTAQFTATGLPYQTYKLEEKDKWVISDQDILCTVGNEQYTRTLEPIYRFSISDTKFYENSLPDGNVECKFGTAVYGKAPPAGDIITFSYAVTLGEQGNDTRTELSIKCDAFPDITGETTSNAHGGGDQPPLEYYKQLGSADGASKDRGIIRDDFKALVTKYPGVIDCEVYGQAEIAPNDKDWMNVVGLMLLTDSSFNDTSFKNLVKYLKQKSIFGLQFIWYKPQPVDVDIKVILHMLPKADLTVSREKVISALQEYTALQLGSLGRSLYASDIEDVIFSVLPNEIDYIERIRPQIDFVINKNQYINITSLTVEAEYSDRDNQSWVNPLDPFNTQG